MYRTFLLLIVAGLFNVLLAFNYGHDGYEAFVVTLILLGLLASWQGIETARFIFASKINLIAKVFQILAVAVFWFFIIGGMMISVSPDAYGSEVRTPDVSWLTVAIGIVPFVITQLIAPREGQSSQQLLTGWVTSIFSMAVLFIAGIGYHDRQTVFAGIILVVAMQLQYLMSYLAVQSDYLKRAHTYANTVAPSSDFAATAIVGAPFALPLIIIVIVSSVK